MELQERHRVNDAAEDFTPPELPTPFLTMPKAVSPNHPRVTGDAVQKTTKAATVTRTQRENQKPGSATHERAHRWLE
jgi:hypothetical protein